MYSILPCAGIYISGSVFVVIVGVFVIRLPRISSFFSFGTDCFRAILIFSYNSELVCK